jgi:hypothetical protein
MRVGVYVDGFNLYYGGRGICGKGTAGWRWLDLRALANHLILSESLWGQSASLTVTYCTARLSGAGNPLSNDSDLAYPVSFARQHVHVGLVNPTKGARSGKMQGLPSQGAGNHWWHRLTPQDFALNQLPAVIGNRIHRPTGW